MSAAARPTFNPATGGRTVLERGTHAPVLLRGRHSLASHTKLKKRYFEKQPLTEEEWYQREQVLKRAKIVDMPERRIVKREDEEEEEATMEMKNKEEEEEEEEENEMNGKDTRDNGEKGGIQEGDDTDIHRRNNNKVKEESDSEESEEDDEDDDEELLRELEKIKAERESKKRKTEEERLQLEKEQNDQLILTGNPLLNNASNAVKRR